MLRRRLLLSVAPAWTLLSCSRQQPLAKRIPLRVALSPHLTMSPFYTGYEAGYFNEAGFDVQLSKELPNVQSIPLLASGKLDVGFPGLTPGLMNAVAKGARIRLVAGREVISRFCDTRGGIFVRRSDFPNGVPDMRQLRHRRIAITSSGTFGLFCLDKLLAPAGMTRADVEIHPTSPNERIAALRAGAVDAILTAESDLNPMLSAFQLAPGPTLVDVLPNFQYSFIAFGSRLLDGDVHTGATFLRAYLHGARDFLSGKTPTFLYDFAKSNNLDPQLVRKTCRDSFEHNGRLHVQDLQSCIDWSAVNGYIPRSMDARNLVDTRFLDELGRTA